MLRRTLTGIALTLSFVLPAHADDAAIQTQFAKLGLNVESVQASPVAGLKLVATDQGIFYASDDGQYFIHGKMFKIGETGITDVAAAVVKKQLEALLPTAIVYKAPKEKYAITVFTDTSCGYCQKLHQELQDYLDAGITVRYLAYPRHGVDSQTGHLLSNIWCAKDPAQAMTDGKRVKLLPVMVRAALISLPNIINLARKWVSTVRPLCYWMMARYCQDIALPMRCYRYCNHAKSDWLFLLISKPCSCRVLFIYASAYNGAFRHP